jgi:hypothetical protein
MRRVFAFRVVLPVFELNAGPTLSLTAAGFDISRVTRMDINKASSPGSFIRGIFYNIAKPVSECCH